MPPRRSRKTEKVKVFGPRKTGVLVLDPQGRQYVATLGPGLAIINGVIVGASLVGLKDGGSPLVVIGDGAGGTVYVGV